MQPLWPLLSLALLGCSTTEPGAENGDSAAESTDACLSGTPTGELGTGDTVFIPVHDGDELPVIHGSQGGNHMLGAVRVKHMSPVVLVHFTLTAETGTVVSDQTYRLLLADEGDCTGSAIALYAYLGFMGGGTESQDVATALLWTDTRMQIDVTDTGGRAVSVGATITPTPGEPPEEPPIPDTGDTANEPA